MVPRLLLLACFSLWSWYQGIEAFDSCGSCLQPPAFISNFTTMRAQSDTESSLTIDHNLGEVPVRVEVQVRPPPGRPDREYVFPGVGSAQVDDNTPQAYGGVDYKYNAQSVVLAVPKKNNNYANGIAIYTGDNVWIGPQSQNEATAEVRVKVWSNCTFPAPDFESSWIPMGPESAETAYSEVEHGMMDDPEYVSVQVKNLNADWYSDGIGSSSRRQEEYVNWGGVIYGANKSHVRVWAPHFQGKYYSGLVFAAFDGWGMHEVWTSSLIKVRVWEKFEGNLVYNSSTTINSGRIPAGHQIHTPSLDIESGLADVKVKVVDGPNIGFYFPASGAVQNARPDQSYGGVVFSYSENGVRFWHPHLARVGSIQQNYLVYIDSFYGGGMNPQASSSGDLEIRFWNSSVECAGPITTKTTTTVMQYTEKSYTQKGAYSGVSKLTLGLIIAASLIIACGCGITGYFAVRKIQKSRKKNKIATGSTVWIGPQMQQEATAEVRVKLDKLHISYTRL